MRPKRPLKIRMASAFPRSILITRSGLQGEQPPGRWKVLSAKLQEMDPEFRKGWPRVWAIGSQLNPSGRPGDRQSLPVRAGRRVPTGDNLGSGSSGLSRAE
ncbi:hypothetical protein HPP92_012800 [Vanilla planifolia]|uniref:Uncharacterized protein n=1 Tax=Vanilla planifolia TaxID=51239 RepID=A0A835QUI7_VANPL|nr:hypothetical protein HPP92_013225 [Vanilla planifolia]KAG0478081.1 hypothetical protein HPP92_012800 [Vanilla planifolia]